MRIFTFITIALCFICRVTYSQNVGINADGSNPDPAAMLDIKSSDKGVLIPRVDFSALPATPPSGLLVYVTANGPDGNNAFYYFDGAQWQKLPASSGLVSSQWTTNGSNVYYNSGNVGIGNSSPKAPLEFANIVGNRKIVFYTTADNDHQFTGLGVNVDAMRYQIGNTSGNHKFYAATSATTSTELFRIQGNGQIVIPAFTTAGIVQNSATGTLSSTSGTATGQMLYWNGSSWVTVDAGQEGQFLRFTNSTPTWVSVSEIDFLEIGDFYQGGIIAYFLQSGDPGYDPNVRHGLIVTLSDQSNAAEWGCMGTAISGADGTAIGTGKQNTLDIIAGCSTAGIAAKICNDLVYNGYSDWYLPSITELSKLYSNRTAIGGFAGVEYWSSSEFSTTGARYFHFNGMEVISNKNNFKSVRAVRSF